MSDDIEEPVGALDFIKNARALSTAAVGIVGSALALSESPHWLLAIVVAIAIAGGVVFALVTRSDSRRMAVTLRDCQKGHRDCHDALHKRDLAVIVMAERPRMTAAQRREIVRHVLGDFHADNALTEIKRLLHQRRAGD